MDFKPTHLKAQDEQVVDMTKLSLQTVASIFQVNPTMIGLLDNANYSNVREFRKSLYGDSLAPQVKMIEDALNQFVLPALGAPADIYAEFNLEEKLRASFEEKAAVTSTAVGAPWMTVNEARAQNNMPAIDGGDLLARPLNTDFGPPDEKPDDADDADESQDDQSADDAKPAPDVSDKGMTPDEKAKLINAVGVLFRSGFDPEASLRALDLPEIKHFGKEPVTLRTDGGDAADPVSDDEDDTPPDDSDASDDDDEDEEGDGS